MVLFNRFYLTGCRFHSSPASTSCGGSRADKTFPLCQAWHNRKAWLFVGNVDAGERSAMMMTLVSSAKRHDLDVGLYIKGVLDQLLAGCTDYASLLPDQWKQRHPEAIRQYRQEERRDKAERKQYRAAKRRLAGC